MPLIHAASMHDISRLHFAACVDVHQAVTCLYMPNAWSSATYKAASACTVQENQEIAYHSHMQMHALSQLLCGTVHGLCACKAQLHSCSSRESWLCCLANVSWAINAFVHRTACPLQKAVQAGLHLICRTCYDFLRALTETCQQQPPRLTCFQCQHS